jgi:hypothetical protein
MTYLLRKDWLSFFGGGAGRRLEGMLPNISFLQLTLNPKIAPPNTLNPKCSLERAFRFLKRPLILLFCVVIPNEYYHTQKLEIGASLYTP